MQVLWSKNGPPFDKPNFSMHAKYIANIYMEIIYVLSGEDKWYAPDVEASKEGENANSTYFYTYLDAK